MITLYPQHFATQKPTTLISVILTIFVNLNFSNTRRTWLTLLTSNHVTHKTNSQIHYKFIQHHYTTITPSRNLQYRFQIINSKYTSPFFLNFTYCIKDTNMQGILRNYDPIWQMYIFRPLTRTFNVDESRPLILPHEYIPPVEIPILEYHYNIKHNHELYNLIQNTPHEFSPSSQEHKIINALDLLWSLLQTKYITSLHAKSLTTSNVIHDIFPNGFFADD